MSLIGRPWPTRTTAKAGVELATWSRLWSLTGSLKCVPLLTERRFLRNGDTRGGRTLDVGHCRDRSLRLHDCVADVVLLDGTASTWRLRGTLLRRGHPAASAVLRRLS